MGKKMLSSMSPKEKKVLAVTGAVQVVLAVAAYKDLITRDSDQIRGPKAVWAVGNLVNIVGPLSYFVFGRKK